MCYLHFTVKLSKFADFTDKNTQEDLFEIMVIFRVY